VFDTAKQGIFVYFGQDWLIIRNPLLYPIELRALAFFEFIGADTRMIVKVEGSSLANTGWRGIITDAA
jgi:hypothetical protein